MGARAAVASAGSALILSLAAGSLHFPSTVTVTGAIVAMLASVLVNDPTLREQQVTTLLLPFPAAAALTLGALAAPHPALSLVVFVAVIFTAVFIRRFGPRGTALGMISFNAFFFALFFDAGPAALPWMIGAIGLAAAVAYAVRFGLIPDRAGSQIRRSLSAYRSMVGVILSLTEKAITGPWEGAPVRRLRRALTRLNEAALALEDLIELAPAEEVPAPKRRLRARVFELELTAGRVAAGARVVAVMGSVPELGRRELARALREARSALRGRAGADGRMADAVRAARSACEGSKEAAFADVQVTRFAASLGDLVKAAALRDEPAQAGAGEPEPAAKAPPAKAESEGLHPMTRQAIQAAVAGALAMALGRWISPSRWFWAVLAAFIVLTRATTVGEIVVRAWHRTLGTILGVVVGMLLAAAIHGYPRVELGLLFACVFLAFYSLQASYAAMVMWITVALALLYSLMGRFSMDLLYVRIAETVAGAAAGATVAAFVLPSKTGGKVFAALSELLASIGDYLDAVAGASASERERPLLEGARALDQKLRELRAAAEPLTRSLVPVARDTVELVDGASRLVFYTRQLAVPEMFGGASGELSSGLRDAMARLAGNARALSTAVTGEKREALTPAGAFVEEARAVLSSRGGALAANDQALPIYWLHRMDSVMLDLAGVLDLPRAEGVISAADKEGREVFERGAEKPAS